VCAFVLLYVFIRRELPSLMAEASLHEETEALLARDNREHEGRMAEEAGLLAAHRAALMAVASSSGGGGHPEGALPSHAVSDSAGGDGAGRNR
jgi:hypothetical protein